LTRCIRTGTFCSYQPDPLFPIVWEFASTDSGATVEPAEQPSGVSAPVRPDQVEPVVPEVSPFLQAERTAFVGRESEGNAIRAVIDRALTGYGSIGMLWD
jgi:hypothetical protein